MPRPRALALAACACALFALPARLAGLVVTTRGGGTLQVASYEVEGDWVRLRLAGKGVMLMRLAEIERVVDDEPVAGAESEGTAQPAVDLGFRAGEPAPETPFAGLIREAARRHGIRAALVAAMARAESGFDPLAVSHKGARGLLQLMPATAERFGIAADRLFDPEANLEAGLRYLKFLTTRYPADPARILAAYNAGEAQVDRYGGVPPFRETREYVRRVLERLAAEDDPAGGEP